MLKTKFSSKVDLSGLGNELFNSQTWLSQVHELNLVQGLNLYEISVHMYLHTSIVGPLFVYTMNHAYSMLILVHGLDLK